MLGTDSSVWGNGIIINMFWLAQHVALFNFNWTLLKPTSFTFLSPFLAYLGLSVASYI